MSKSVSIHARIKPEIKEEAEKILHALGMTTSGAIEVFYNQIVLTGGLPFPIMLPTPNADTLSAMEEAERISKSPNVKSYSSFSELLTEVENEV